MNIYKQLDKVINKNRKIYFPKYDNFLFDLNLTLQRVSKLQAVNVALDHIKNNLAFLKNNFKGYDFDYLLSTMISWKRGKINIFEAKKEIVKFLKYIKTYDDYYSLDVLHSISQACSTLHSKDHFIGLVIYDLSSYIVKNRYSLKQDELKVNLQKIKQEYIDQLKNASYVDDEIAKFLKNKDKVNGHVLSLNKEPFVLIKNHLKTIEMRLYDEKRKKIKIGDNLIFKLNDSQTNERLNIDEFIKVKVIDIRLYDDFEELYENNDLTKLGYRNDEIASYHDMEKYYSIERIEKYGALAIEFEMSK